MKNPRSGFTLIELLVVIAIIGLLSSVVFASLNSARAKARDARRIADLTEIRKALELYFSDTDQYPATCPWSSWACWSSNFIGSQYIARLPVDPLNIDLGSCGPVPNCHIYRYCQLSGGARYVLGVNLENPRTPPQTENAECSVGGPNYYWIGN